MSTTNELKVIHDRLLEVMPHGSEHRGSDCFLCAMETPSDHDRRSGGEMPETFSQEDLDAAVAAASAPLQQRLAELEAQAQQTEIGRAVADAVASKDAAIKDLEAKLDAAVAAQTTIESELVATHQFWADAVAAHQEAVAFAARREERISKASELGVFSEDYLASNADRFAAMTDEDFSARIDEWRLIAKKEPGTGSQIPAQTALKASRGTERAHSSALDRLTELRARRVDPRTLGGV